MSTLEFHPTMLAVSVLLAAHVAYAETIPREPTGTIITNSEDEAHHSLHYHNSPGVSDDSGLRATEPESWSAAAAATDGSFLPFTLSPRIARARSWIKAVGGYDTAARDLRARSSAESALASWLSLRVDYEHGSSLGVDARIGVGGRVQVINQRKHGIDGGVALFYQPNDFRREGSIAGGLLLGRNFENLAIFGNALFGSDPEGDDQELDGRLAALTRLVPALRVGVDNRFRLL